MPYRMLMVEDDPIDVLLYTQRLQSSSHETVQIDNVSSVHEGAEKLRKSHYDMVLLDLNVSDSFGPKTATRIRKACPDTPIVALSGMDSRQVIMDAIYAGADDYLIKGKDDGRLTCDLIRFWQQHYHDIDYKDVAHA